MKISFKLSYLFLLVLFSFLIPLSQSYSQVVTSSSPNPQDFKEIEQVMVTNVSLDTPIANAGDTISGKITLFSTYQKTLPGLSLRASLVSGLKDLNFDNLLDRKVVVTDVALPSHQSVDIPFSYDLPKNGIADHNAIYIEVITSGGDMIGFNAAPIKVSGFLEYAQVKSAFIYVNKDKFTLEMGPTITKGDDAHLTLSFIPPQTTKVTLYPHVSLYHFEAIGTPLKDTVLPAITLKGSGLQDYSLPLDTFNNKAGVYAGEISLEDASGTKRSQLIDFRYIVKGNIATIRTITTDKQSGRRGDVVNVNVEALGNPYDILTGKTPDMGKVTLALSLANTEGVEVAHYNTDFTFNGQEPFTATIPLTLTKPADTLTLHATLTDDQGVVLDEKTINLSGNTKGNFEHLSPRTIALIVGSLLLLISGALIFFLGKFVIRKVNKKKHE